MATTINPTIPGAATVPTMTDKEQRFLRQASQLPSLSTAQQSTLNSLHQKYGDAASLANGTKLQADASARYARQTAPATPAPTSATTSTPSASTTTQAAPSSLPNVPAPVTPTTAPAPQSVTNAAVQPNAPTTVQYQAPDPFNFNYNYMTYDQAQNQASQQFNPLYEQAVKNLQAQEYQNKMASGEEAANRGIAQSGLAADALNKIAIATQNNISDLNAQKMSNIAQLAQQMMQQDQSRGDALRQQMYSEYSNDRNFGYQQNRDQNNDNMQMYQQAYQQYRDSIGDNRYTDETAYNRGRDTLSDQRYDAETAYNHGRDARSDMESDRNFDLSKTAQDAQFTGKYNGQNTLDYTQMLAVLTGKYNGQDTYQAKNDALNNALNIANVTGVYNGKKTAAQANADRQYQLQLADLTGTINGNPTLAKQAQDIDNKVKLGQLSIDQARLELDKLQAKKASSGGGGGGSGSGISSIQGSDSSIAALQKALDAYNAAKKPTPSNLDIYYSNPVIQQAQKTGSPAFKNPVPPAQSPYLTDYEKMKMLFG